MTVVSRPNVLLVIFDSLSAAALDRLAGELPTLTALHRTSVAFSNAYVCSPENSPARASLFTGLDMAAHGLWTDGVTLPRRETTISKVFLRNGYRSWLVGRRHLAGVSNWTTEHARDGEFHNFDWAHGPLHRSRQNAYLAWLQGAAPESYAKIFPSQPDPDDTDIPPSQRKAMADLPDDLSFNTWVAMQFRARIEEHGGESPFFGIAGFVVGETMGAKPQGGASVEALETRALQQSDAALKTILEAVPKDTIVVVTAGRGNVDDGEPMHNDAIKVPLLIRTPDRRAETIAVAVSTMDVAPTLYEAANITPPKRIQGRSLLTATSRGWAMSRLRNPDAPHQTGLCTDRWKLVMSHDPSEPQARPIYRLYDLHADPSETKDLARNPAHAHNLEIMIDLMIDARVALEDRTEPRVANF